LVKGQGHMGFVVFICVRDTAATRGQCLALSKAGWSCCYYYYNLIPVSLTTSIFWSSR